MAYDPTSDAGTVRLLISDLVTDGDADPQSQVFTDAEVTRFLTLEGGDTYRAAAAALLAIAGNETLRLKYIRSKGLELDGPAVGSELRMQARDLREQANVRDDEGSFMVAGNPDGYVWP